MKTIFREEQKERLQEITKKDEIICDWDKRSRCDSLYNELYKNQLKKNIQIKSILDKIKNYTIYNKELNKEEILDILDEEN